MTKHTEFGVEEHFFNEPTDASRIKQKLVKDYFISFTNVLAHNRDVGYADLFAGPGRYKNGEKSIPLLITEHVISSEWLRNCVRLWFNEGDPELYKQLETNIFSIPGVEYLRHRPSVTDKIVGKQSQNREYSIPTFVFADPCGYKGLSLRMIGPP